MAMARKKMALDCTLRVNSTLARAQRYKPIDVLTLNRLKTIGTCPALIVTFMRISPTDRLKVFRGVVESPRRSCSSILWSSPFIFS